MGWGVRVRVRARLFEKDCKNLTERNQARWLFAPLQKNENPCKKNECSEEAVSLMDELDLEFEAD